MSGLDREDVRGRDVRNVINPSGSPQESMTVGPMSKMSSTPSGSRQESFFPGPTSVFQ
jgi:hypothetical protein